MHGGRRGLSSETCLLLGGHSRRRVTSHVPQPLPSQLRRDRWQCRLMGTFPPGCKGESPETLIFLPKPASDASSVRAAGCPRAKRLQGGLPFRWPSRASPNWGKGPDLTRSPGRAITLRGVDHHWPTRPTLPCSRETWCFRPEGDSVQYGPPWRHADRLLCLGPAGSSFWTRGDLSSWRKLPESRARARVPVPWGGHHLLPSLSLRCHPTLSGHLSRPSWPPLWVTLSSEPLLRPWLHHVTLYHQAMSPCPQTHCAVPRVGPQQPHFLPVPRAGVATPSLPGDQAAAGT